MMKFRCTLILTFFLSATAFLFANSSYDVFTHEDEGIDSSVFSIRKSVYDSLFRGNDSIDWNRDGFYLFVEDDFSSRLFFWNDEGFVDIRQQPLIEISKYQYPREYHKKRQDFFGQNLGEKCHEVVGTPAAVTQQVEKGVFGIPFFEHSEMYGRKSLVVRDNHLVLGFRKKDGDVSPFYIRLYQFNDENVWKDFSKAYERLQQTLNKAPFSRILEGCK